MKNNTLLFTLLVALFGFTATTFPALGELVEGVAQVPGKVVEGTGKLVTDVGDAITPEQNTGSVAENVVRAPGQAVSGAGRVISDAGVAITPSAATTAPEVKKEAVVETTETEEFVPTNNEPMGNACPFSAGNSEATDATE